MYKLLDKLVNEVIHVEMLIPINEIHILNNEYMMIDDVFVGLRQGEWVAFDSVCDHNGGQLILDADNLYATCPLHKWRLKLSEGQYENGCSKKALVTRVESENLIVIKSKEVFPEIAASGLSQSDIHFKFNAHASVSVDIDDVSIISDPWFIGSCFANGWWHAFPPSFEAIERLINSDFIYISHNHPDHLHIPTLERYVERSKLILVPNFESKSVENLLRRSGFENLILCDFMREIHIETKSGGFKLLVVKSGDDRDDSSLLICTGNRKIFLGVDTNMPNRWVLPEVDVLFTPFSSGASGFPVRIENFSMSEKVEIVNSNRLSMLNNHVSKLVRAVMPDYVIPYAGYFSEIDRDNDVKSINIKNSPQDLISYVEREYPNVMGINPIDTPCFRLGEDGLKCDEILESPAYFVDEEYVASYISCGLRGRGVLSLEELMQVGERFLSSAFVDNLTIVLIPSNDTMTKDTGVALVIDFSSQKRSMNIIYINGQTDFDLVSSIQVNMNNLELLRVREESLALVVRDGAPLEDLSIGFQVKMYRRPNVYNFKFWDHFTNKEFISI